MQTPAPLTLTEEEKRHALREGFLDPVFCCRFYLRNWFPTPMPWVHRGMLAILLRRTDFLLRFGSEVWYTKSGRAIHFEWTPALLEKLVRHFTFRVDPADPESPEASLFTIHRDVEGNPVQVDLMVARNTLLMLPRGFSKTTLTNAAAIISVLYQMQKFILYVGETQHHSERQLKNVRMQLETNERIAAVFGPLRPEQRSGLSWSDEIIQTTTGITLAARARGGQVRGFVVNGQRPDWIILDDVEDKESVSTETQREKARDWFFGDLMPATSEMDNEEGFAEQDTSSVQIVMLATLLHAEALAQRMRESEEWTSIVFGALDKDGEALWPAKMGVKKIERVRVEYGRQARLHIFYLEYFNTVRAPEKQTFKGPFLYNPTLWSDCVHRALSVDPAIAEQKDSDYCAFGVVGISEKGVLVVAHADGEIGMSPREQVNEYFRLSLLYDITKHGVETIAYQKALLHLLREEMFRKRRYFEITPIGHYKNDKITRVSGILAPRYASGYITHTKPFPKLETQLLDWPNGKKDLPDVISQCIILLDPYAALAAPEGHDLWDDEYDEPESIAFAP